MQSDLLKCIFFLSLEFNNINSKILVDHHIRWNIIINFRGNRETSVSPYTHRQLTLSSILKSMVSACISSKLKASEGSPHKKTPVYSISHEQLENANECNHEAIHKCLL